MVVAVHWGGKARNSKFHLIRAEYVVLNLWACMQAAFGASSAAVIICSSLHLAEATYHPRLHVFIRPHHLAVKPSTTLGFSRFSCSWFPTQDAFELLQKSPGILNNIEEADNAPDPTYGERARIVLCHSPCCLACSALCMSFVSHMRDVHCKLTCSRGTDVQYVNFIPYPSPAIDPQH